MRKGLLFGIIALLFVFMITGCRDTNTQYQQEVNEKEDSAIKKAPINAEIGELDNSGKYFIIINRNNYDWHNVKITVNDYYSCWSRDVLKPGEGMEILAVNCNDFVVNQRYVKKLVVEADEGSQIFTR